MKVITQDPKMVVPPIVKSERRTFLAEYNLPKQVVVVIVEATYTRIFDVFESSILNPRYAWVPGGRAIVILPI